VKTGVIAIRVFELQQVSLPAFREAENILHIATQKRIVEEFLDLSVCSYAQGLNPNLSLEEYFDNLVQQFENVAFQIAHAKEFPLPPRPEETVTDYSARWRRWSIRAAEVFESHQVFSFQESMTKIPIFGRNFPSSVRYQTWHDIERAITNIYSGTLGLLLQTSTQPLPHGPPPTPYPNYNRQDPFRRDWRKHSWLKPCFDDPLHCYVCGLYQQGCERSGHFNVPICTSCHRGRGNV
jgi:hypothetical protein